MEHLLIFVKLRNMLLVVKQVKRYVPVGTGVKHLILENMLGEKCSLFS